MMHEPGVGEYGLDTKHKPGIGEYGLDSKLDLV